MKLIEELKLKLESDSKQKLKESHEQLNCIKIKINASTDEMVNILRENQKKLLNKTDEIQRDVNKKFNPFLNEYKLESKSENIEQLEKHELEKVKDDLHKIKTSLEAKLIETNISCNFQFIIHSKNVSVGEIITDAKDSKNETKNVNILLWNKFVLRRYFNFFFKF